MRKYLAILIFVHYSHITIAQSVFSSEKSNIITKILNVLTKTKENARIYLIANTYSKLINAQRGIGASLEINNQYAEDTLTDRFLKDTIERMPKRNNDISYSSFADLNFNNRYTTILQLIQRDSSHKKDQLYIEIQEPIDGWKIPKLFAGDSLFSGERYMRFQIPRLCIPVFCFEYKEGKEKSWYFLFRFAMEFYNGKYRAVFLDVNPV